MRLEIEEAPTLSPTPAAKSLAAGTAATDTSPTSAPPMHLPWIEPEVYSAREEIGRGGMGMISTAFDRRLGRTVAIKELRRGSPLVARFEREIRLTAKLSHPSIVGIHEAGRWPSGEPFYAMNYVRGRSLDAEIERAESLEQRIRLVPHVIAVADALGYAHQQRVIHRDLKPHNVMVGDFSETIVIDWGLAKELDDEEDAPTIALASEGQTQHGDVIGTPMYMPPEQAKGEAVDARADVYAIGAILYHVLAGRPPYTEDVLKQLLAAAPEPLTVIEPRLPPDLVAIVERAMAREPDDRYSSARELAADLRRFHAGQLVGAHRYTVGQRVRRMIRKYRVGFAVAAVSVALLAALGAFSLSRVLAERREAMANRADAEGLLAFMLDDLATKLRPSNRLDLVGDVATKATDYYEKRSAMSVESKRRHAAALRIASEVELSQSDVPGATARITQALAILKGIDTLEERARAQYQLARILETSGNLDGAIAQFRDALATAKTANSDTLVGEAHMAIGQILREKADYAGALSELEQYLVIALRLAKPTMIGRARYAIGAVFEARGDRPQAIEAYRSAIVDGDDVDARSLRGLAYHAIGLILLDQDRVPESVAELDHARRVRQLLVDENPSNTLAQRDLASVYDSLGDAHAKAEQWSEARAEYAKSFAILEPIAARHPDNPDRQSDFASALERAGDMQVQAKELDAAIATYSRALKIIEGLVAKQPANTSFRSFRVLLIDNIGNAYLDGERFREAIEAFETTVKLREELLRDSPSSDSAKRELATSLMKLGIALRMHKRSDAKGVLRRALVLVDEIVAAPGSNPYWKDIAAKIREILAE